MVEPGSPGQIPKDKGIPPEQGIPPERGVPPERGIPPERGVPPERGRLPGSPGQVPKGAPGQVDIGSPGQMFPNAENPWAPGPDTEVVHEADQVLPPSDEARPAWEPPRTEADPVPDDDAAGEPAPPDDETPPSV